MEKNYYLCTILLNKGDITMKEYIKQKAKERNISLQAIADKLGLKSYPSFLRTIETGENLKAKQLKTIADMLGCTIDELVSNGKKRDNEYLCPHCGKPFAIHTCSTVEIQKIEETKTTDEQ